jgi:hypothetical protein
MLKLNSSMVRRLLLFATIIKRLVSMAAGN